MEINLDAVPEDLNSYGEEYAKLKAKLKEAEFSIKPLLKSLEISAKIAWEFLGELTEEVKQNKFQSEEEEINFFKRVKPLFLANFIYFRKLFEIECKPFGPREEAEKYFQWQRQNIYFHFLDHSEFYRYIRSGAIHLDKIYFLRSPSENQEWIFHSEFYYSGNFTTSKSNVLATMIANNWLDEHLKHEIEKLHDPTLVTKQISPILRWTAPKVGLVELIYALQSVGAYNNGNADLKLIASYFEKIFSVELGNFFNTFSEMRLRKKNRTVFLDHLRDTLIKRMDEADERYL